LYGTRESRSLKPNKYAETFGKAIAELGQKGYTVIRVKNYCADPSDPYQGVNDRLTAPNGQKFELQLHTQESFDAKNGKLHELYEQRRLIPEDDSPEAIKLDDEMLELSKSIQIPEGAEGIK
jgi:hypothetical protein